MRTAIFGSWREGQGNWNLRGTHSDFVRACEAIGREFAHRYQVVIVGGESPSAADVHVVRGIVKEAVDRNIQSELVEVIRPDDDVLSYEQMATVHPHLFVFHSRSWGRWAETHLMALDQADAVLTIAGMKGTLQVGLAAIIAKKPIIPIASFGGASAELIKALETRGTVADIPEFRQLNKPWTDSTAEVALRLLGIQDEAPVQDSKKSLPRVFILFGAIPRSLLRPPVAVGR
jgi:hypothetical protein